MKTVTILVSFVLALPAGARAQEVDPWVGRIVILKDGASLKVGDKVVDLVPEMSPSFTVGRANGQWLWLANDSGKGWARASDVVRSEDALDYYTSLIKANLQNVSAYIRRGLCWSRKGGVALAISDYNECLRIDPKCSMAYNNRSWIWATCEDDKVRDGKKAVQSSLGACELSNWSNTFCLGTLAAGYAESGDFKNAIKSVSRAIELDKHDELRETHRAHLKVMSKASPGATARGAERTIILKLCESIAKFWCSLWHRVPLVRGMPESPGSSFGR